jgi:5'-3' exoribonuclease 2
LNSELEEHEADEEIIKNRIIKDYICLCFFIGNDFLPSLPGLDINIGSIDLLLEIYCNIFSLRRKYLIDENNNINFVFVKQILFYLFDTEKQYLRKFQNKVDKFSPRIDCESDLSRELSELNFYPVLNKNNYLKLGQDNWIDKYYKYYFNVTNSIKDQKYISRICANYIEGLQWNIKYYLDECASYSWHYKFRNSPLLKDLCYYLINRVYPTNFENDIYSPLEQLSLVLPIQCKYLWCGEYKKLVEKNDELKQFYPLDYELDTLNKVFLHDCDPILCNIDGKIFFNIC